MYMKTFCMTNPQACWNLQRNLHRFWQKHKKKQALLLVYLPYISETNKKYYKKMQKHFL